jgi:hypothetical protein
MEKEFKVDVLSFAKISEIKNAWVTDDYIALLAMMDIAEDELSGMNESELHEMCLMSLNDFEHHESANFLLRHIFKDDITEGKIDQLSHQMAEDNLWEEYPEPAYHMGLFNAYGLLRKAYNGIFSEPTGVHFTLKIRADKEDSFDIFEPSPHAVIVRILSKGLSETVILNRLYDEQLRGDSFHDAKSILWILKEISSTENERQYEITSSELWFGELNEGMSFTAKAHADTLPESEDEDGV